MSEARKPTKIPPRTVFADDLAIRVDGVDYYPHAGESVTFRAGKISFDDYMATFRVMSLQSSLLQQAQGPDADIDPAQLAELDAMAEESMRRLQSRILATTWTDQDGNPYSSPFTLEELRAMNVDEVGWLQAQIAPREDDGQGNGATASTGSSTAPTGP